jgi:hypothetical protein
MGELHEEDIMVPDKSSACWRQLVTGNKTIQTESLALQMLLKRMQRSLHAASPTRGVDVAAEELHAFFVKYEKMLANEIKSL